MESQLKDKEGLGSKLDKKDRATIEDEIKEKKQWMEDAMSSATAEDFEDKLAEFQSVISVSRWPETRRSICRVFSRLTEMRSLLANRVRHVRRCRRR
jgi:hypothetical protein